MSNEDYLTTQFYITIELPHAQTMLAHSMVNSSSNKIVKMYIQKI